LGLPGLNRGGLGNRELNKDTDNTPLSPNKETSNWGSPNIDFPLTSITCDVEVLNKIRECGFYYQPPKEDWELIDQEASSIQEPSFCYQINSEE